MAFKPLRLLLLLLGLASGALGQIRRARCDIAVATPGVRGFLAVTQFGTQPASVQFSIFGLTPGSHGVHVHQLADLGNLCNNTGAHFNPNAQNHGGPTSAVRHVGDVGNINANALGAALGSVTANLPLSGNNTIVGRAFVVHAGPDDLGRGGNPTSLTTGNSGGRVACCVIRMSS